MFVREAWAAICLQSQPEALMISSGSAVNSALTRNDLTPVVSPPSSVPHAPSPVLLPSIYIEFSCTYKRQNLKRDKKHSLLETHTPSGVYRKPYTLIFDKREKE